MNSTSNKIRWEFRDNDPIFYWNSLSGSTNQQWFRWDCAGSDREIVLDCVPEHLTLFSWSSTNWIRRWMDLEFVFSTLQNLAPPSFGQLFVGFHYDANGSNPIRGNGWLIWLSSPLHRLDQSDHVDYLSKKDSRFLLAQIWLAWTNKRLTV